jgi:sialate O-acetylesterase
MFLRENVAMRTLTPAGAFAASLLVLAGAHGANCAVKLPGLLSSHMVLQREMPIHLWGWSDPGEKITVELHGVSRATVGNTIGAWSVYLPPETAGGPYRLTVSAKNEIILEDILIGDVWFASGQSNMEMPLKGFPGAPLQNSAEEIAHALQPEIRLINFPKKAQDFPQRNIDASWTACTPETAANFSAAAYFFGRELNAREHVPIGLIDATWGGTPAEAWVSLQGIAKDAALMPVFATRAEMMRSQADSQATLAAEKREDEAAKKAGQPPPQHAWRPDPSSWAPSWLFNGMVAPATPYAIKGVIWYQGESNSRLAFAPMYAKIFPALIADWRERWREGDFPFLFVQIANFKSNDGEAWAVIREAQRRTLAVAHTAMVVTTDIGNPDNVHPADKQTVGARLALAARALAYGEKVEDSGPLFRQATTESEGIRVWFDHTGGGLKAGGDTLQGFEIAGSDGHFVAAAARIDGNTVVVSGGDVADPKYVRYGWANAPSINLFNTDGLPASPFTSEDEIPPK